MPPPPSGGEHHRAVRGAPNRVPSGQDALHRQRERQVQDARCTSWAPTTRCRPTAASVAAIENGKLVVASVGQHLLASSPATPGLTAEAVAAGVATRLLGGALRARRQGRHRARLDVWTGPAGRQASSCRAPASRSRPTTRPWPSCPPRTSRRRPSRCRDSPEEPGRRSRYHPASRWRSRSGGTACSCRPSRRRAARRSGRSAYDGKKKVKLVGR